MLRTTKFEVCRKCFCSKGEINHKLTLWKYLSSVKWEISYFPWILLNRVSFIFHCADDYIWKEGSLFND